MRRSLVVPALLVTLTAAALCFMPLFNLLGYEFCLVLGVVTGPASIAVGLGAARDGKSYARALARALAMVLPALGLISLNALRVQNCNYKVGLGFFALLPAASALYGAAVGHAIGKLVGTRRWRVLAAIAVAVVPLGLTLWTLYWDPPIFAFDHLFGHFAGSLYDEVVELDARLVAFRVGTLLRLVALGVVVAALGRKRYLGLGPALVSAGVGLCCVVAYERIVGPRYGFRVTRADLARALPVVEERPGLLIHLPTGISPERRRAIADDHAFRLAQLTTELGVTPTRTIHSYVYRSADEKARLMGGRSTMIAKPWLFEIHVHEAIAPHPVVAHELAHVVAAFVAPGPLHVTSRYGVFANMGLVEGLAEGLTPPRGELDLDAYSHALRSLDLAPDLRRLFGPAGFWSEAPRRAYTIAGSFVRFLLTQHGPEPLKRAYADGDFAAAYGQPIDALVSAWEHHVDQVPLSDEELRLTEEQFKQPSIFNRACAHEIAALRDAAGRANPGDALSLRRDVVRHLGDNATAKLELAMAERRAEHDAVFLAMSNELLGRRDLTAAQQAQLREAQGDLAWQQDDVPAAQAAFRSVLAMGLGPSSERLQWVRLWALEQPNALRRMMRDFLSQKTPPVAAVLALEAARRASPEDKTPPYLVARQLVNAQACAAAIEPLEAAAPHPDARIEAERLRLLAACRLKLGDVSGARRDYARYAQIAPTSGERARGADLVTRLDWLTAGNAIDSTAVQGYDGDP